ncbi:hypothetical protein [Pseudomonas typographi]|uniref:hypothetical protein n=1 Tax=Pseudomonas typographi TaxID=2715964 RepID=UPI001683B8CB|nr:hypothetical protein [Pseudomonas typographi]MBD1589625.1 hypothetical protein [Pseudomonas typographi]
MMSKNNSVTPSRDTKPSGMVVLPLALVVRWRAGNLTATDSAVIGKAIDDPLAPLPLMSDLNVELAEEIESLRPLADRAAYWKQRAKSAEGHLWASDFQAACDAVRKISNYCDIPADQLSVRQKAHISSVVAAVLAEINTRRAIRLPHDSRTLAWCACGDGYPAAELAAQGGVCENCQAAGDAGPAQNGRTSEKVQGVQEGLEIDAARYRWLRGRPLDGSEPFWIAVQSDDEFGTGCWGLGGDNPSLCDRAIDKAMAAGGSVRP